MIIYGQVGPIPFYNSIKLTFFPLNKIVSFANEEIVEKAILLLKDIYIHLGPQLKLEQVSLSDVISKFFHKIIFHFNYIKVCNTR